MSQRYAQRMYTLLSLDGGGGVDLARQTYEQHVASGAEPEPDVEAWLAATPGTPTFVKLQRVLMAQMRQRMA